MGIPYGDSKLRNNNLYSQAGCVAGQMLLVGVLVLAVLAMGDSDTDEEMASAIRAAQSRAIAAGQASVSPRVEPE